MQDKFELPFSHSDGGYVGHKCVAFDGVDNVAERTLEALDVKCGKIKTKNH